MNHDNLMVHNRDRPEIFQNSLIERTPKAVFRALNLSIKHTKPFTSDLKTDQEVLKGRETVKGRWRRGLWPPTFTGKC